MKRISANQTLKNERPSTSNLTFEERLKVITNLIVDRILEDQLNGTLLFKNRRTIKP
jgi:hypothetical protein